MHKEFLARLPTPYASIECPDCSEVKIKIDWEVTIEVLFQGVRINKWFGLARENKGEWFGRYDVDLPTMHKIPCR